MSQAIPTPDIVTNPAVTISELIAQLDLVHNDTAIRRSRISNKVMQAIDKMNLDGDGDAEQLEAQVRLVDLGEKLIASTEKSFANRITMRIKQQDSETAVAAMSAITSKVLQELDVNKVSPFVPTAGAEIDKNALSRIENQLSSLKQVAYNDGEIRDSSRDVT